MKRRILVKKREPAPQQEEVKPLPPIPPLPEMRFDLAAPGTDRTVRVSLPSSDVLRSALERTMRMPLAQPRQSPALQFAITEIYTDRSFLTLSQNVGISYVLDGRHGAYAFEVAEEIRRRDPTALRSIVEGQLSAFLDSAILPALLEAVGRVLGEALNGRR